MPRVLVLDMSRVPDLGDGAADLDGGGARATERATTWLADGIQVFSKSFGAGLDSVGVERLLFNACGDRTLSRLPPAQSFMNLRETRSHAGSTSSRQMPPPQRYCHATPSRSKLFPVRAETPLLA